MRTNVDIDDTLMAQAQAVSRLPTKKATIEEALRLLIHIRGQEDILQFGGKIRWTGDLDVSRGGRETK